MTEYPDNFSMITKHLGEIVDRTDSFAFLVGAGISMNSPSNIPSARQFVQTLLELFAVPDQVDKLLSFNTLRYEKVVEELQRFHDPDLKFLDFLDMKKNYNLIHEFLAEMIRFHHFVITTNFDYLIERALMERIPITEKHAIVPIITKQDYLRYSSSENIVHLNDIVSEKHYPFVKIHGSKKNIITGEPTMESLVTTITALGKDRSQGETFAIEIYKKPLLNALLRDRVLIVMGYSGNDDFSVVPLLKEFPNLKMLIWLEHRDTPMQILKIKKPSETNPSKSTSNARSLTMLTDLSKRQPYEIYYIVGKTLDIVAGELSPIFSLNFETKECLPRSSTDITHTPDLLFSNWIQTIYPTISELQKYKMTALLLNDLGEIQDSIAVADRGSVLADKQGDFKAKAWFLFHNGSIYSTKGDHDQALVNFKNTLQIEEQLGNFTNIFLDLNQIGNIYRFKKNFDEAQTYFEKVLLLDADPSSQNPYGRTLALNNLGDLYRAKSVFDLALKCYKEALDLQKISGDLQGQSVILHNIGVIHEMKQEYDLALQYYAEAMQSAEGLGNLHAKSIFLNKIAMIYRNKLDYQNAIKFMEESMRIAELLGDFHTILLLVTSTGGIYNYQKQYLKALALFEKGVQIAEKFADTENKDLCLDWIDQIIQNVERDDLNQILTFYENLAQTTEKTHNLQKTMQYLQHLGLIYQKKGNIDKTITYYEQAIRISEDLQDLVTKAMILSKLANIYSQKKDLDTAIKNLEEAQHIGEQLGNHALLIDVLIKRGSLYQLNQNNDKALEIYDRALQLAHLSPKLAQLLEIHMNLGILYYLKKENPKALQYFEDGLRIAEDLGDQRWINKFQKWLKSDWNK